MMRKAPIVLAIPAVFGVAHAESLDETIATAYRSNPNLEAARYTVRAAQQTRVQARAAFMPVLTLDGGYGTSTFDLRRQGQPTTRSYLQPTTYSFDATQAIYTGGRRAARLEIARAAVESAREDLRVAEQDVALDAVAAHVNVIRDQEIVRLRRADAQQLERQTYAVQRRLDAGVVTRTDVSQAQARLAVAQAGVSQAEAQLEGARAIYTEVVGREPGELVAPAALPEAPQTLREAVDLALESNPFIRSARQQERAARAQIEVDRASLRPQISFTGRYESNDETSTPELEERGVSAVARVRIPLFEGGLNRSRMRQARFNALRAEAETEALRRQVVSEVVGAWNQLAAARRVLDSARVQVEANQAALAGVEREQALGLRTTIEVLNATSEVLASQITQTQAQRDVTFALHRLLAATGRLDGASLGYASAS
ncbi:MAG: TolC family outer membrane protein [Hyphomonadaceae bacterium]|nr:TolC family outer membrane protein [Hyphomonadaceae bacterium]